MSGLVERLRKHVFHGDARLLNFKRHSPLAMEAADTIEELVEACFKARHRLLKEGFLPEDPTVRAVNAAIDKAAQS